MLSALGRGRLGERVHPLVQRMPGMAAHLLDREGVGRLGVRERLPEVSILHRGPFGGPPAVLLPAGDPLREPLGDQLAVGDQCDLARARERPEARGRPLTGPERRAPCLAR